MNTLTRLLSIGGIAMLAAQARPAGSAQATPNPCASPANTIVAENCKPGNARTEWDINSSGDSTIQGFATDMSVNLGETISFKIDTDSPKYRIDIYRMGWYGGSGARLIETIRPSVALPQAQPDCLVLNQGRLVDCGNWKVSASWQAPANGVSGVYVARLVREDDAPAPWRSEGNDNPPATKPPAAPHSYGASGLGTLRDAMKEKRASHIVFVVRDDASRSDVLFQTADPTWVVTMVEVSTDGGTTWKRATGTDRWTYEWDVPLGLGTATILSRTVDDSVNLEIPSKGVTIGGRRSVTP
jgi:hypothetical protein